MHTVVSTHDNPLIPGKALNVGDYAWWPCRGIYVITGVLDSSRAVISLSGSGSWIVGHLSHKEDVFEKLLPGTKITIEVR